MGKIDELIKELCPDGVEYKALECCVRSISTGLNPRKNFILNVDGATNFYVTVKEISTNKIVFSPNTDRVTNEALNIIQKRSRLEKGDILFSGIGTIGKVVYVDIPTDNWNCSESIFLIKPNNDIHGKYLSYILISNEVTKQYEAVAAGAIMKGVRKSTLEKLQIPLPPLSIQQEIVEILDTFTDSISNLQEELELREKQMEYYRENILSFDKEEVEYVKLGKICDILTGFPFDSSKFTKRGVRLMRGMNIKRGYIDFTEELNRFWETSEKLEKYLLKEEDIVISMDGSLVGRSFAFIYEDMLPLLLVQRVARIRTNEGISKYIYHYIQSGAFSIYVDKKKTKGAIPHISMSDISCFAIPVPSLSRQQEIVDILDTFESMITNIKEEIELRQKQYEYYREKLLTFERKGA